MAIGGQEVSAGCTGPRKVIDLDGIPVAHWPIEENAVFIYRGKLWSKEKVGCVVCIEMEGPEFVTLVHIDDAGREHFHCMEHGELIEVPYSMTKLYKIVLGGVEREGEESLTDSMLLPAETTQAAQVELIEKLLDEAQAEEAEAGPIPEQP
jgi:hypothetical protein